MNSIKVILVIFSLTLLGPDLSQQEWARLNRGEIITKELDREGGVWPELTHYMLCDISPLDAVSIFGHYELQSGYAHNILGAEVQKSFLSNSYQVKHYFDLPWPMGTSYYVTRNTTESIGNGGYRIRWEFIDSEYSRNIKGSISFVPNGTGSLIWYQSFVEPKSILASLFTGKVVTESEACVISIKKHLDTFYGQNTEYMIERRRFTLRSLGMSPE